MSITFDSVTRSMARLENSCGVVADPNSGVANSDKELVSSSRRRKLHQPKLCTVPYK